MKVRSSLAVFSLATAVVLEAQQQSPLFRGGTNAVQLDVRAVDDRDQFVPDLKLDEFRVFEDDKPQTISSLQFVDLSAAKNADDAPSRPASGRYYLIVLDDQAWRTYATAPRDATRQSGVTFADNGEIVRSREPVADVGASSGDRFRIETSKAIAREFVQAHVIAGDHVALATTSGRTPIVRNFASSRASVLEAIDQVEAEFGQDEQFAPSTSAPGDFQRPGFIAMISTLRTMADWLAQVPGRRKGMVIISQRLSAPVRPMQPSSEERDLVAAANRGNVALYTIDPVGVPSAPHTGIKPLSIGDARQFDVSRRSTFGDFASLTDGFTLVGTNDFTGGMARIVEESSRYYLLGYTSTDARVDDHFRKLRVEVTRPGVSVRTRSGYVARQKPRKVEPLGVTP